MVLHIQLLLSRIQALSINMLAIFHSLLILDIRWISISLIDLQSLLILTLFMLYMIIQLIGSIIILS
jgi:hypothetical protein